MPTTNFKNSSGTDIGNTLVEKSYLIDRYPGLADTFKQAGAWSWGMNNVYQLSDGTTTYRSSPVQVLGGGTNWTILSSGRYHATGIKSDGTLAQNATFPDTDFPLFRMADAYLMYAELAANGFGDIGLAVGYVNDLRTRGGSIATITASDLTPDFVLDERAKELYWEGHRRQDLIRFGKYLTGYNWQWKGGSQAGVDLNVTKLIYPIPRKELISNSNLSQNPGYN